MSLVVAEWTDQGPVVVSDTRVSFSNGTRSSFKTGTLKAIVVAVDVVLCFAGDVVAGPEGVRKAAAGRKAGEDISEVVECLAGVSSSGARSAEFLVVTDDGDNRIIRIRSGLVERRLKNGWIGDRDAFERFQRERLGAADALGTLAEGLTTKALVMLRLRRAMDAVIDDDSIPSVDDFCVAVTRGPKGFEYLGSAFIFVGRDMSITAGEPVTGMAQPVAEGGYAVSVVEPRDPGTPALGLNFPRARIGMVYLPLEHDEAQIIRDVSTTEFVQIVQRDFGVALKSPPLSDS